MFHIRTIKLTIMFILFTKYLIKIKFKNIFHVLINIKLNLVFFVFINAKRSNKLLNNLNNNYK